MKNILAPLSILFIAFLPASAQLSFDNSYNFVIHHYSANKKYELISIPQNDVGDESAVYIFVTERKSGNCLYRFTVTDASDDLFILTNDGKTVFQLYGDLNVKVNDPRFRNVFIYKNGEISDTIYGKGASGICNLFYAHKIKNVSPQIRGKWFRVKHRRGSIAARGDTLRIRSFRYNDMFFEYATLKEISAKKSAEKNKKNGYRELYYRIELMNGYEREKLFDRLYLRWRRTIENPVTID